MPNLYCLSMSRSMIFRQNSNETFLKREAFLWQAELRIRFLWSGSVWQHCQHAHCGEFSAVCLVRDRHLISLINYLISKDDFTVEKVAVVLPQWLAPCKDGKFQWNWYRRLVAPFETLAKWARPVESAKHFKRLWANAFRIWFKRWNFSKTLQNRPGLSLNQICSRENAVEEELLHQRARLLNVPVRPFVARFTT